MGRSPFRWPLIAILTGAAALNYCDRTALSAVYPLLRAELGVSDAWLGALGSAFLWSYALGSPLAGWLADRTSRTRIVLVSLAAWSAVTLLTGLARDAHELLATRLLLGLAECAYLPAAVGLLADHHGPAHRGTAIGLHTAALSVGTVAGATLAGYLGERHGWRITFLLLGAAGLVLSAAAAWVLRGEDRPTAPDGVDGAAQPGVDEPSEAPAGEEHSEGDGPFRLPSYWVLLAQSMVASVGIWLYLNWLPLYCKETFGMSLAVAGFSGTLIMQAPGTLGVIVGGSLSDQVARTDRARRMGLQTLCYLAGAPLLLTFAATRSLGLVAAAVVTFSLLRSMAVASENPLLCDLLPRRQRSRAIGLMNTANCAAGGIGVLAGGLLKTGYGLGSVFAGVSLLVLAAAAITAIGYFITLPRDLRRRFPDRGLPLASEARPAASRLDLT